MMKCTPKSCSCGMCKFGKHTRNGHFMVNYDERSFRRAAKAVLHKATQLVEVENLDAIDITPAPIGNYYD